MNTGERRRILDLIDEKDVLSDEVAHLETVNAVLIAALKFYAEDGGYLAADANAGYAQGVLDGLDIEWTDPHAEKARKVIWTE